MSNRFAVLALIVGGIIVIWFAAKRLTAARAHQPISTLSQYRMVGAVMWIGVVCMFYVTELVVDVQEVQDHNLERQCENRNLNRFTERRNYETRIKALEDRVAEAEGRAPIVAADLPGYGDYRDPAVLATVDALIQATEASRIKDIRDANDDLDLVRAEYEEYVDRFPLQDCDGDGVIEPLTGDIDVRRASDGPIDEGGG